MIDADQGTGVHWSVSFWIACHTSINVMYESETLGYAVSVCTLRQQGHFQVRWSLGTTTGSIVSFRTATGKGLYVLTSRRRMRPHSGT